MRKTLNILILLFSAAAMWAARDTTRLQIVDISRLGDEVQVIYDLPLKRPAADYKVTIQPALTGEKDTLFLEPVVLNGWNNIRQLHRDHVLNHKDEPEQDYYPQRLRVNVLRDTVLLPVGEYRWLLKDGIGICRLEQVKEGCCRIVGQDDECSDRYTYDDPVANELESLLSMITEEDAAAAEAAETSSAVTDSSDSSKSSETSDSSDPTKSSKSPKSSDGTESPESTETSESSGNTGSSDHAKATDASSTSPAEGTPDSGDAATAAAAGAGSVGTAGTGVSSALSAAQPQRSRLLVEPKTPAAIQMENPIVVSADKYVPFSDKQILSRDTDALYVYFALDSIRLRRHFRNNGVTLDSIVSIVTALMQDERSEVRVIQIVGVASIEGNEQHNNWLAGERAKSLKQYIVDNVPYPIHDSVFHLGNGGEAWADLRYQVEQSRGMQGRAGVLKIIDSEPDPQKREWQIRTYQCGKPYEWIKNNLLGDQRNSGYIRVFYTIAPDARAKQINDAIVLLGKKKYLEAEALLREVEDDPRAWFPLGIALYMTGSEAEGEELWEKAAAAGNEEAQRTLSELKGKR